MEFAQQNLGNCLIRQNWLGLVDSANVVTTFLFFYPSLVSLFCLFRVIRFYSPRTGSAVLVIN